ncbi:MAG: hypothetical protein US30_C0012G0055 [Candidatus Moranbacteria bacterium GW2011_GWF2_36_839]|nr:MAG: hypothetical protein US27_C0012G0029 [Candidatus Moranbacteria bacterium GW2011_GWF1_36_78]KKQ16745.1 MAG: hypothetical protein US30_C0012G0055 [Candidatus Moranbacteria bacterium GW2011_GWF2_36_839]HAT74258.1 hypothetical protein [Candidatus Moranbacteria bacterium]HBY11374.1 hypothetical protein [Candidatus Moranbacteria bacterium]
MDIIKESKNYALSEIDRYGSPTLVHFGISEQKAIALAKKLGADEMIVRIGVTLMDLKLGQALKENRLQDHVSMSIDASEIFLKKFNLDKKARNKIINCIEAHHKQVAFNCLEAEICANADCYRFIHPRGFFAYLTLLGKRYESFDECLNQAEAKLDEKNSILSLDICKKELNNYYTTLKDFITDSKK